MICTGFCQFVCLQDFVNLQHGFISNFDHRWVSVYHTIYDNNFKNDRQPILDPEFLKDLYHYIHKQ